MNKSLTAIRVRNLTKSFKENNVLKCVSFTVQKGSIFTLLGSNGAGKTTIIKILTTLMHPDEGSAEVYGYDVVKQARKVRSKITLTGQNAAVDELLTGHENLQIIGALRNLPNKKKEADTLLELFRLTDASKKLVSTYSGGMRRRLDIAMSMMGRSPVVFLDEPTTGLDPQNRLAMWDIIKQMATRGKTVFLTTQYLEEAEYLASHIVILHKGEIIANGTSTELKKKIPQGIVQLQFKNGVDLNIAKELLNEYTIYDGKLEYAIDLQTDGSAVQFVEVLNLLIKRNIKILHFAPKQPTLEDAFLILIGEKKEEVDYGI